MTSITLDENLGFGEDFSSSSNNVRRLWDRFQGWGNDRKARAEEERQQAIEHLRYLEGRCPVPSGKMYFSVRRDWLEQGVARVSSCFSGMGGYMREWHSDFVEQMEEKGVVVGDFSTTLVKR